MGFDDIIAVLPTLSVDELDQLAARCSAIKLLGGAHRKRGSPEQHRRTSFVGVLFDAFAHEIHKRTEVAPPPFTAFARSKFAVRFEQAAIFSLTVSDTWFPSITAAEQRAVAYWFAELVFIHMQSRAWETTWPNISQTLLSMPQIFDTAYPNYARSGMAPMLLELRVKGKMNHVG